MSESVSPEMLGITLDTQTMVNQAYQQGRSLKSLQTLAQAGWQADIPPRWQFFANIASQNLQALAPQFDVAPVNASLVMQNGQASTTLATPGQKLDVEATLAWLSAHVDEVMVSRQLTLAVAPVPPETATLGAVATEVNKNIENFSNRQFDFYGYDPVGDEELSWTLEPAVWNTWLRFDLDLNASQKFTWQFNESEAQAYLANFLGSFEPPRYIKPELALPALEQAIAGQSPNLVFRLFHPEKAYRVQPGDTLSSIAYAHGMPYPWLEEANPSIGENLQAGQTITIPSPDRLLPLPVVDNKRIIMSLSEQRVKVYENGQVKWDWPASSGIDSSPTSPGVFQIQSQEELAYASNWDLWMPSFMGIYRPVPNSAFMNGFHGFPTRNGQTLLWTNSLGKPATYGCILISSENAEQLFAWAEEGIVVEVQP